ncbi:uncharacterized protein LOC126699803 [Quercus robur]|uniref:uncharacterized protein LOC126699803 n=1 Tax=Quercus robur TaxID=38942 RepID=UPI0021633C79|nr:uncharacterized protein LOC126699803 [Quercus robur]
MGDIRMITGGGTSSSSKKACKAYLQMVQNIQLIGYAPKMVRVNNPIIGFTEEDARRLHHPHADALVVSIRVGDYNTYRVLQMRIEKEQLIPTNASLIGIGGTKVYPLGAVTLPVTVRDYPQQIMRDVTFLVVDYSFAYNAILGHPTLNSWKAVTSTYHLMIKFPTEYGVGEVRGDQVATREYYIVMLEMDDHQQTICIEEQQTAKPMEELEEVTLDDSRLE